jgi:uroporphyrinogen-III synthase
MPTPILLLKTKSSPHDGYEDFFTANNYTPTFIPVLEHRFQPNNLTHVRNLFTSGAFNATENAQSTEKEYGGLIFTSQRAVEGFAQMIEDNKDGMSAILTDLHTTYHTRPHEPTQIQI